jgi:hypothetical protein
MSIAAGQQELRGLKLGAEPALLPHGGVELHPQVATWVASERNVAFCDVLWFRIE